MSTVKVIPGAPALAETIGGLLGRGCTLNKVGPSIVFSAANRNTYLALYQTSEGEPAAVVQCDMRFAAGAATSLAMMPVACTAEERTSPLVRCPGRLRQPLRDLQRAAAA